MGLKEAENGFGIRGRLVSGWGCTQGVENRPRVNLRKDSSLPANSGQSAAITQESSIRSFL